MPMQVEAAALQAHSDRVKSVPTTPDVFGYTSSRNFPGTRVGIEQLLQQSWTKATIR